MRPRGEALSGPPPGPDLTFLWGIANRAVRDPELRARPGGVVQNVWEAYKQTYLDRGEVPPPLGIRDVNPLISTASAQYRAETQLANSINTYNRTGLDQAIGANHIAADIDRRAGAGDVSPAFYRVRYSSLINVDGETMTRFRTWSPQMNLPNSVSGLLSALDEAARADAEDYDEEHAGLGGLISITVI